MTAIIVRMKKIMAMGLLKKMRGSPSEITRERRSPFSSMGARTKAIINGMGDMPMTSIINPTMPKTNMVKISNTELLMA
jgi:hypothetical protein